MMAMDEYRLHLDIPALPRCNSASRMSRWVIIREKNNWARIMRAHIGRHQPAKPLKLARVVCRRYSSREPDFENLAESFKQVIDALVRLRVLEDDKRDNFVGRQPEYHWQQAPPRKGRITIDVYEERAEP
jgi:hypothetical protein